MGWKDGSFSSYKGKIPKPSNGNGTGSHRRRGVEVRSYEVARTYDLLCGCCLGSHWWGEIGEEAADEQSRDLMQESMRLA